MAASDLLYMMHPDLNSLATTTTEKAFAEVWEPRGWVRASGSAAVAVTGTATQGPQGPPGPKGDKGDPGDPGGGTGTSDHAQLANLAAGDPHPQYAAALHAARHATAGADPLAAAAIGAAASGHTHTILDADLPASIARDAEVASAVSTHAAAGDPHPGYATDGDLSAHAAAGDPHPVYLTSAEGTAAFAASGHGHVLVDADIPAAIARDAEVTAAVNAHAALADPHAAYATDTDLANHAAAADPHSVYLTSAEGNAAYPPIGHTHAGLPAVAKVAADVASTVVAMADVTGMTFPVLANTSYGFLFVVAFTTAAITTGIKLAVNGPALGAGYVAYTVETPVTTTSEAISTASAYDGGAASTGVTAATPTVYVARVHGVLRTGATPGTFALRFATEVVASAATVKIGSWGALF